VTTVTIGGANFPNFKARLNEVIALDAELCYSDAPKLGFWENVAAKR
jgi:hypothetical protein